MRNQRNLAKIKIKKDVLGKTIRDKGDRTEKTRIIGIIKTGSNVKKVVKRQLAMITIYHNPRCSKSRQTLALLIDRGVNPEIVLYLDNPPSVELLSDIITKLGFGNARDLIRKGESIYKELDLKNESDDDKLIQAMSDHPKLIERPIVIKGEKAVLGRPPENVKDLI